MSATDETATPVAACEGCGQPFTRELPPGRDIDTLCVRCNVRVALECVLTVARVRTARPEEVCRG